MTLPQSRARTILAVVLEWPLRHALSPILDMLTSLDEGSRQAREQCAADVEQALRYEEELRDAA